MKREIVLDTETTGLDPAQGHKIIEIGCVEMVGTVRTGKTFHAYLNPERDVPEESTRIHGITDADVKDKPIFAEKVDEFLAFIADSALVIHNAGFDMRFINAELEYLGFKPISMSRTVDTVMIARKKFPGSPANLDALCRRFDIDLSARTKHGALLDAELLSDVYLELLGGKQAALGLDSKEGGDAELLPLEEISAGPREAREFKPSAEELQAHEVMLEQIKEPLWKKAQSE